MPTGRRFIVVGRRSIIVSLMVAGLGSALLAGCGSSDTKSAVSSASTYRSALAGAPAPLARLYSKPNELLNGGPPAFKRQLATLAGYPVVVNKWASWCGPCRFEFPFFQRLVKRYGKRVAFLGVDGEDARDAGKRFLSEFPVPYPSFFDPHSEIAKLFKGDRVFPTTAFYNGKGELIYTKPGGYAAAGPLEKDIQQYALAG